MSKTAKQIPCPCGRGLYATCCEPFHAGKAAPTVEALMRSRYSAYVLQLTNYVHATWHPSTRPAELSFDDEQTKWLGLDVRQHSQQADTASVEFVARYKINGRAFRLHEISRFVREESSSEPPSQPRWYYLDGELLDK